MFCGTAEFVCAPSKVRHIPVLLDEALEAHASATEGKTTAQAMRALASLEKKRGGKKGPGAALEA